MVTLAEAAQFRADSNQVTGLAAGDLAGLFRSLDIARPEAARDVLVEAVPTLATAYGDACSVLAAEWYDQWRSGDGVRGSFRALAAPSVAPEVVGASVRALAGGLWSDAPSATLDLLTGMLARVVLQPGRDTITSNVRADPEGRGWRRVAHAESCDFCLMLAGRGGVYRSDKTSAFSAHDRCRCTAVPSWDARAVEVPARTYEASLRMESVRRRAADASDPRRQRRAQQVLDRHRERTRDWIADMKPELDDYRVELSEALAA